MKQILFVLLVAGFLPALLTAQPATQAGNKYVELELQSSPFISGGYFLKPQLALSAGVAVAFNGELESNGFSLRLGMDRYLSTAKLTPVLGGYARFDINPNSLGSAGYKGAMFILGGYWGLNYFVLPNLAVGGNLGGEFQFNSPENADSSVNLLTITSGIRIKFFF